MKPVPSQGQAVGKCMVSVLFLGAPSAFWSVEAIPGKEVLTSANG